MTKRTRRIGVALSATAASVAPAVAELAHRPFAVGGGEGGGGAEGGVTGWIMAEQSQLTHLIAEKVHALHGQPGAAWGLVGLGLAYGVVHAAGPGHGKAILASYMMANERSLKLGAVMALLTALLQALVAIGLVGAAGFVFNATASEMNRAADWLALASYCGITGIGLMLVWRKGGALGLGCEAPLRTREGVPFRPRLCGCPLAPAGLQPVGGCFSRRRAWRRRTADGRMRTRLRARSRSGRRFSWRNAAGTVIAAGARPCSGAILVLVFALAQGLFAAGIAATFAMALGVAVTTGALAWMAVFAKSAAMRLAAGENSRLALVARGFEFAAALAVLAFGVALMLAARGGA